jgi:phage-related protein
MFDLPEGVEASFTQKLSAAAGNILSTFTFGLLDATQTAKSINDFFNSSAIQSIWGSISDFATGAFDSIGFLVDGNYSKAFETAKNTLSDATTDLYDGFTASLDSLGKSLGITPQIDAAKKLLNTFINGVTETIGTLFDGVMSIYNKVSGPIGKLIDTVVEFNSKVFGLGDSAGEQQTNITNIVTGILNSVLSMVQDILTFVSDVFGNTLSAAINNISLIIDFVGNIITGDFSGAFTNLSDMFTNTFTWIGDMFTSLGNLCVDLMQSLGILDAVESFFTAIKNAFISIQEMFMNVIWFFQDTAGWLADKIDQVKMSKLAGIFLSDDEQRQAAQNIEDRKKERANRDAEEEL